MAGTIKNQLSMLFVLLISISANAQTVKITFDEVQQAAEYSPVGARYTDRGVIFSDSSRIIQLTTKHIGSKASSGSQALVAGELSNEFNPGPLVIYFLADAQKVSLTTGSLQKTGGETVGIALVAMDSEGGIIDRVVTHVSGQTDIDRLLEVTAPGEVGIRRVELQFGSYGNRFEILDDLTVTFKQNISVTATRKPTVVIDTPKDGVATDKSITLQGTIEGWGLYPDQIPPKYSISFQSLNGENGYLSYSYPLTTPSNLKWQQSESDQLPGRLLFLVSRELFAYGKNRFTVRAENAAGIGTDSVEIDYFPADVMGAYTAEGGASTLGSFVTSTNGADCVLALYTKGLISKTKTGVNVTKGSIFDKWLKLSKGLPRERLGCAISAERNIRSGRKQDFQKGRIYSTAKGVFYTVQPFLNAMDAFDFENEYGLPVTDPVHQSRQLLPKLWQKFENTWHGFPMISSMEVTDKPDTLWVAIPDIEGFRRADVKTISRRVATVWYDFLCDRDGEPCRNVGLPKGVKRPSHSKIKPACGGTHYPAIIPPIKAPAWVSLKQKSIVPYIGNVRSSGLSSEDSPWNHACSTWKDGSFPPGFEGVDWNIGTVPSPGYEDLLFGDATTVVSQEGLIYPDYIQEAMEIEYEWCLVGFPSPEDPKAYFVPGDLIFVAGRWIADCGCHPIEPPYAPSALCRYITKSEIHPPAAMVDIYTDRSVGTSVSKTKAELIYFDWWYPGENVSFRLHPPPRPEPDYLLSIAYTTWKDMCPSDQGQCGVHYAFESTTAAPNHIEITLNGRPDVAFNTPPQEDWDGQLHHGYARPVQPARYVPGGNYPHTKSLWGTIELSWGP